MRCHTLVLKVRVYYLVLVKDNLFKFDLDHNLPYTISNVYAFTS